MDNFLNQIEKRTNFYLDDTVQFRKTNSTLLNNSIFSKKWYLYDVETYNYFVEDYGDDFKKYLNEFYDNNDVDIEHSFLFTNPDMFIYGLDEKFAYFFDNTFETEDEFETNSSFKNTENIKKKYFDKIKQYVEDNKLLEDSVFLYFNTNGIQRLLNEEWQCFLYYKYFDGQHDINWIINTNPNSVLFEYVFVCGCEELDFFHFSEIDNKIADIEKVCNDFDLLD